MPERLKRRRDDLLIAFALSPVVVVMTFRVRAASAISDDADIAKALSRTVALTTLV